MNDYRTAYKTVEEQAGYILTQNLQDTSFRSALSLAGWKPGKTPEAQAVEWFQFDFEYASVPVGKMISVNMTAVLSGTGTKLGFVRHCQLCQSSSHEWLKIDY